jgi:hypothetical protein
MSERAIKLLRFGSRYLRRWYSRQHNLRYTLVAALIYTLAALVVTYPLILDLSSTVVGKSGRNDGYQYAWSLWWAKQAIFDSEEKLVHLSGLNHPVGQYQPFVLTMLTVYLTALPLLLVFPVAVVYNLLTLISFTLCGLSVYWFASEQTGSRRAGLISGFAFAFFPNRIGHLIAGHLPQITAYWGPLFAFLLWRVVWKPGWRKGLLCGLVLIPALLVHPLHVVYFVAPVTLAILLYAVVRLRSEFFACERLWALGLAFGMAAVVVIPILWPSISAQQESGYLTEGGTIKLSLDLLALFTPSPYHPVLQPAGLVPRYAEKIFPKIDSLCEGLAYPGLIITLLGIWALVKRWRQTWIWMGLAVVSLILSLGPILKIGGESVVYEVDDHQSYIVLPYALVKLLPLFRVSRTPNRLNETVIFALAVSAAFGFISLPRLQVKHRMLSVLAGLMAVCILFEYLVIWPLPLRDAAISPVIQVIAAEDSDGALFHLPLRSSEVNHLALYYQTFHQRPIVGGKVHRERPENVPWETTLLGLVSADPAVEEIVPRPDLSQRRAWLRHFDIDYIVLHKQRNIRVYRSFVENVLGLAVCEDDTLAAFAVPTELAPPDEPLLYTISKDWHPPVQGTDGDWRRWIGCGSSARIYVYAAEAQVGRLAFTVEPAFEFTELRLEVDDTEERFVVAERSTYTSRPLVWESGVHTIHFKASEDCESLPSGDNRTFAFESID